MALLDASAALAGELALTCHVASVDHGLRAGSSAEVDHVRAEARKRRLPFHAAALHLPPGPGAEERARIARYEALERLRAEAGADLIATAHTATDQAETLLMRLARGASLSGAAGVLPVRGRVVRPMLACTREEVRSYVAAHRLWHAEDPMNQDAAFLRARIRADALPALERAAGPGAAARLARFAELAGEDSLLLDEWARAARRRMTLEDGSLDAVALRALERPLRRRVLASLLADEGLATELGAIALAEEALLEDRDGATWPEGAVLRVRGGRVRVDRGVVAPGSGDGSELVLDGPAVEVGGRRVAWTSHRPERGAQPVRADGDRLVLRARQPGDRVRLPGGRTRKLQDVLVDARVPREERDAVLLVCEPGGLVVCALGVWPRGGGSRTSASGWISVAPPVAKRAVFAEQGYNGGAGVTSSGRRGRER